MTCPECGYVMTAFDKDCPRCKTLAALPPAPAIVENEPPSYIPPPVTTISEPPSPLSELPGRRVSYGWTLLFGPLYFLFKGWWKAGVLAAILWGIFVAVTSMLTFSLTEFLFPFVSLFSSTGAEWFVNSVEGPLAMPVTIVNQSPAVTSQDHIAAIAQLAALRDKGIVTEEEFQAKRAELLSRV